MSTSSTVDGVGTLIRQPTKPHGVIRSIGRSFSKIALRVIERLGSPYRDVPYDSFRFPPY
ncbi:MAG TPA: hypothetical protein VME41_15360 [Stellaceae bacterium]|nr:hypothetical protein [Stellaceae bacterium]